MTDDEMYEALADKSDKPESILRYNAAFDRWIEKFGTDIKTNPDGSRSARVPVHVENLRGIWGSGN